MVQSDRRTRFDKDDDRGRLWIEWLLFPPGVTFSRVAATVLFFVMMHCLVFTSMYVAMGGDVCGSERAGAERVELEVEMLRAELKSLEEQQSSLDHVRV